MNLILILRLIDVSDLSHMNNEQGKIIKVSKAMSELVIKNHLLLVFVVLYLVLPMLNIRMREAKVSKKKYL